MIKLFAKLTGLVSRAAAPLIAKLAIALVAVIVALVATASVQTYRLGLAQDRQGKAETLLQVCKSTNSNNLLQLESIEQINKSNIKAAKLAIREAEAAALLAVNEREMLKKELDDDIKGLQAALVGNDCAGDFVPANLDRLFRNATNRDQNG